MLLRIEHDTRLTYSEPVSEHVIEVRMGPPSNDEQTSLGYRLNLEPSAPVTAYRDGFGNRVDLFNLLPPAQEIVIRSVAFVRTHRRPGAERLDGLAYPLTQTPALESLEYLHVSPLVGRSAELDEFADNVSSTGTSSLRAEMERLIATVRQHLRYEKKVTNARTPIAEVLRLGCGVCQDFAHLFLGLCRLRGLPARYVSGYVHQPGEIATHAWCQVHAGIGIGWVDVDPTHACFVGDDHVVTAVGRDYSDVPPNRGVWKGDAEETITVLVKVEPVERLPGDWIDLDLTKGRRLPAAGGVRRSSGNSLSHQVPGRSVLRQQQNQQQQAGRRFR